MTYQRSVRSKNICGSSTANIATHSSLYKDVCLYRDVFAIKAYSCDVEYKCDGPKESTIILFVGIYIFMSFVINWLHIEQKSDGYILFQSQHSTDRCASGTKHEVSWTSVAIKNGNEQKSDMTDKHRVGVQGHIPCSGQRCCLKTTAGDF